ncbi:sensor histidine kinase [Solitalea koreensis]|uniref:histidine kinase n=1 Tax=Solitalea koreensis TaxID=543615 RepID=A0A521AUW2_9SPHI|nr:HAMP domain-containing sensor histidine kinase [Solitalea koreensis]SMO38616.1 two-component system, OmpR family, phosphate regulon sensor histidine kinase PhoR [Solitalea koreensis]
MEKESPKSIYRKNLPLISSFVILVTLTLVIGLLLGYKFTQKFVEGQFDGDKAKVLDKTIENYNDLVNNRIPQISLFQGYLDSVSVEKIVYSRLRSFPFINSIVFYDTEISNHPLGPLTIALRKDRFSAECKGIYKYGKGKPPEVLYKKGRLNNYPSNIEGDFNAAMLKFASYVEGSDTTRVPDNNEIFKTFYTISDNKISYLNVPRREEIRVYKDFILDSKQPLSSVYEHDLLTFNLNPYALQIRNTNPRLYETVLIKPFTFDSLSTDARNYYTTGIALPGAFSDYQLYFISSKRFINKEIFAIFKPIAISFIIVYLLLMFIAYLIFRNMNINQKLFKLQYDFINNLTHEFKTPVSVIKIAGDNIRSSDTLSDRERLHYGKILNEEADKLNDLMNKLLSFTQLENKSIKIKYSRINIEIFCQNQVDAYQLKYPDFDIQYSLDDVDYLETDIVLLNSVFTNLIDNAYKYSPSGRKQLTINITRQKRLIIMNFIDQGIGIEKSELENIFKKFYKVDNEFNRHGSVGIGLAFCKEVVNFMHGEIEVKSKPGKGSEFKITLPLKRI